MVRFVLFLTLYISFAFVDPPPKMRDPQLVRKYREFDQTLALYQDKLSTMRDDDGLFVPSVAQRQILQAEIDNLTTCRKGLDIPDDVFFLLNEHFADFIEGLQQRLDNYYQTPSRTISDRGFTAIIHNDTRPDTTRKKAFCDLLKQHEQLYNALFEWIDELPVRELGNILGRLSSVKSTVSALESVIDEELKELNEGERKELHNCIEKFIDNIMDPGIKELEKMVAVRGGIAQVRPWEDGDVAVIDLDKYRMTLKALGVDLDDMLSWYKEEVEKSRNECFAIANALDIPEKPVTTMIEVNDILFKYAGPADSPEEMFARATEYVTRATAAAREYVWLPEDADCMPIPMAESMKASYPWGAGGSADRNQRPFVGHFMLNDDNYKAITDGWLKINCCHEVHPGHYTQWIRTLLDPLPETLRRGAKHTCLTESMCLRTEKLFESVYSEDPFYPLFTAYRRHHCTIRILADIICQVEGQSLGAIVDLYKTELGFDDITARKLIPTHSEGSGYFTTYYYGYKKVVEWEEKYGFDKKEYTELLFSAGRMSLENFERYLKLSDADRFSLTHEFASLLHF